MALTCGGSCMKTLLFIFNGLFFLGGVAMMAIGIWFLVDPSISEKFEGIAVGADTMFRAAAITLIVVGVLILVVGFFGCCGAIKESACMLCTFVILIVVIFILQLVVIILGAVFKDDIAEVLVGEMEKQVVNDVLPTNAEQTTTSLAWHSMQYDLQCCGAESYKDYRNNTNFNTVADWPMPKTCCRLANDDYDEPEPEDWEACKNEFKTNVGADQALQLHVDGCYMGLQNWFKHKAGILIGIACGVFVIELLGIVFACCVRKEIKKPNEYV